MKSSRQEGIFSENTFQTDENIHVLLQKGSSDNIGSKIAIPIESKSQAHDVCQGSLAKTVHTNPITRAFSDDVLYRKFASLDITTKKGNDVKEKAYIQCPYCLHEKNTRNLISNISVDKKINERNCDAFVEVDSKNRPDCVPKESKPTKELEHDKNIKPYDEETPLEIVRKTDWEISEKVVRASKGKFCKRSTPKGRSNVRFADNNKDGENSNHSINTSHSTITSDSPQNESEVQTIDKQSKPLDPPVKTKGWIFRSPIPLRGKFGRNKDQGKNKKSKILNMDKGEISDVSMISDTESQIPIVKDAHESIKPQTIMMHEADILKGDMEIIKTNRQCSIKTSPQGPKEDNETMSMKTTSLQTKSEVVTKNQHNDVKDSELPVKNLSDNTLQMISSKNNHFENDSGQRPYEHNKTFRSIDSIQNRNILPEMTEDISISSAVLLESDL